MIVRGIAMGHGCRTTPSAASSGDGRRLVNGIVWGGLLGVLSWVLYGSAKLGAVMTRRDDPQPAARRLLVGVMGR